MNLPQARPRKDLVLTECNLARVLICGHLQSSEATSKARVVDINWCIALVFDSIVEFEIGSLTRILSFIVQVQYEFILL